MFLILQDTSASFYFSLQNSPYYAIVRYMSIKKLADRYIQNNLVEYNDKTEREMELLSGYCFQYIAGDINELKLMELLQAKREEYAEAQEDTDRAAHIDLRAPAPDDCY